MVEENAAFMTEIVRPLSRATVYFQQGGHQGCGNGHGASGRFGRQQM